MRLHVCAHVLERPVHVYFLLYLCFCKCLRGAECLDAMRLRACAHLRAVGLDLRWLDLSPLDITVQMVCINPNAKTLNSKPETRNPKP